MIQRLMVELSCVALLVEIRHQRFAGQTQMVTLM